MDIFEIAQQGMKIQAQEQKELQLEQEAEAKGKSFKLDIHEILIALAEKDYDWFRYDKKGNPKLVKRNIANELGISESNYIQTMKRIQEKIDNVFVLLFQDYLDNNK